MTIPIEERKKLQPIAMGQELSSLLFNIEFSFTDMIIVFDLETLLSLL